MLRSNSVSSYNCLKDEVKSNVVDMSYCWELFVHNSLLNAVWKFGAPSLVSVLGLVSATSLPLLNSEVTSAVFLVSATCCVIQKRVFHPLKHKHNSCYHLLMR